MTRLQDDLLGIYNSLTDFSNTTLGGPIQLPISVEYSDGLNSLCFEQKGTKVAIGALNYYCENLKNLKKTYLLPDDYDKLMSSLSGVIGSGVLLHDRVCVSPTEFGFRLYETQGRYLKEGPQLLVDFKFVSGDGWFFKRIIKFKYKNLV